MPQNIISQDLKEEKIRLVWMYNAIQEKIDAYWLDEISIDSWPFKKLCSMKQQLEHRIREINKELLETKNK